MYEQIFKNFSPSLCCPECCGGEPARPSAPVALCSGAEPPAAADSSDRERRHVVNIHLSLSTLNSVWWKQIISGGVISCAVCSGCTGLTVLLFSCRRFSSSYSSCCLALSKSSWPCFVLDRNFTVSAFCTEILE